MTWKSHKKYVEKDRDQDYKRFSGNPIYGGLPPLKKATKVTE